MKNILQLIMAGILLSLTSHAIAYKTTFKDLQFLENNWYVLVFPTYFMATDLEVFETRDDYLEGYNKRKDLGLLKIPSRLKQVIFSKQTTNPFRSLFPYIYTAKNKEIVTHCGSFEGVQLELDDNPKTSEWYVVTPAETCLRDKDFYRKHPLKLNPSEAGHNWLVQKQANGHYRILMESEGSTNIYNKKHQGYKDFTTQVYNSHIYRHKAKKDSDKYCGKAWIEWKYKSGSYQPTSVDGLGCKYNSEEQSAKQEREVIIPLVLHWLNIYTPESITVNEKKEVIPVNSVKNSQSSFNQDELNAINKLLH